MHGLINRSIQCFLRDTYGAERWTDIAREAQLGFDSFEAMMAYDDRLTDAVIATAARQLDRSQETILEDLGTYLVSHRNLEPLRRLLRFGGVCFVDFLHSLDDLQGRGRLAVSDLDLPHLELRDLAEDRFLLLCRDAYPGFGHVVMGILRAMADDYGALVVMDHKGPDAGIETIEIDLLEKRFSEGRRFELAARAG